MGILKVIDVHKKFGPEEVLKGVSLELQSGKIYGLLGPNGAGKTTLIKILSNTLQSDSGEVLIDGKPHFQSNAMEQISFSPQFSQFPESLKSGELLDFVATQYGKQSKEVLSTIEEIYPFESFLKKPLRKLSGGQKRFVNFLASIVGDPQLVVLDEPTTGMDVPTRKAMWVVIQKLADQGKTILFSTHYLQEIEEHSNHTFFLNHGEIIFSGSLDELLNRVPTKSIHLDSSEDLTGLGFTKSNSSWSGEFQYPEQKLKELYGKNIDFTDLRVDRASLERIFEILCD